MIRRLGKVLMRLHKSCGNSIDNGLIFSFDWIGIFGPKMLSASIFRIVGPYIFAQRAIYFGILVGFPDELISFGFVITKSGYFIKKYPHFCWERNSVS